MVKKYELSIATQVERDLDEIIFYKHQLGAYQSTIDSIVKSVYSGLEQLQVNPLSGPTLNNKTTIPTKIRYLILDEYLLFYEFDGQQVKAYRVLSSKQDYITLLGL